MSTILVHRPARTFPEPPPSGEIRIVPPPTVQVAGAGSWIQYMLPLTGVLGSLGFVFIATGQSGPQRYIYLALIIGATVLTMVGGVALRQQQMSSQRRQKRAGERRYVHYLERQEAEMRHIADVQRSAALRLHPDTRTAFAEVIRRERLWERRPGDQDVLEVRVGVGKVPLACPIGLDLGNNPLVEYEPRLLGLAQGLVDAYTTVPAMPAAVGLAQHSSVVVTGEPERTRALLRAVLCELAGLHSPDDLHLLAAFPAGDLQEWEWLKWLPHVRRGSVGRQGDPVCRLADGPVELQALLEEEVGPRVAQLRRGVVAPAEATPGGSGPRLVIVLDGMSPRSPLARVPMVNDLLTGGAALGVLVISLLRGRRDEPSSVGLRIEIDERGALCAEEANTGRRLLRDIVADAAPVALCDALARAMAPLRLGSARGGGSAQDLSENVRLLELLDLAGPEEVEPQTTWTPRSRLDLLRVPIGVTAEGEPIALDLKESAEGGMGPHGMVIGATGSGKSELLRSLVTALAVTHGPEVLSFVFVDFKGGAAFADLAGLPHVAGLITNLSSDLTRVDRMRQALAGEQERRQRMLREAGNLDGIKEYQRRRALQPELEPMPYLVIVVDEFGELLGSRPDFLDLFIGIGRIGRSIGMHLLLSSQRLEEGRIRGLEGHLRYRLCLRTFSAAESSSVIGTPDAYHLPAFPGIGYLKVDTTVYTRFKAAIVSTPFRALAAAAAGDARAPRPFAAVRRITDAGGLTPAESGTVTEMQVAVRRLQTPAVPRAVHQVWLPPLEPVIPLDAVVDHPRRHPGDAALTVSLGVLDLPAEQVQVPLVLDFSGSEGHLALVGAPQTGKSTLLRTLVTAFALSHSPRDVQIYAIDLGGGALFSTAQLPHVGAVCGKGDRDRIRRVVREMQTIIEERELVFRRHGVDGMATWRRLRAEGALPASPYGDVFLVVDNWGQLRHDLEDIDQDIQQIVSAGLAYGVHVIIATNRWGELRTAVRDNMGRRLELRLNDPSESEIGRHAAAAVPAATPGRGITQDGHQFQVALPRLDGLADVTGLHLAADAVAEEVARRWPGAEPAAEVRMLPLLVTPADLAGVAPAPSSEAGGIPVGVEEFRLEPVVLDLLGSDPHLIVLGDGESGKTSFLRTLLVGFCRQYTPAQVQLWVVDYRRTLLDVAEGPHIGGYALTAPMVKDQVERLRAILTERLPSSTLSRAELLQRRWWTGPEQVMLVDDYDLLTGAAGNPLQPLLEFLSQGRDVGFHLVIARRVGGAARGSFEAVYQRLRELNSPGLVMSGDPQEGPLVGTQKAMHLPAGRGMLVRRGQRTALVQTVYRPPRAMSEMG